MRDAPAAAPASCLNISAQSSTEPASGPMESMDLESGSIPVVSISPVLVFRPTTPLNDAGTRMEPPVSVPIEAAARPDATATADPDDDPPGARLVCASTGLSGVPKWGFRPSPEYASSDVFTF